MKMYEIFYNLDNGNYSRITVYGRKAMKKTVKEFRQYGHTVRVYNEYGFKLWWI